MVFLDLIWNSAMYYGYTRNDKQFSADWIEMKPLLVDIFILFNIFGRKNKISKLLVGIRCKQGKGVLNCEIWQRWSYKVLL